MKPRALYIASSWRNKEYENTVEFFRNAGHMVWNWRNPPTGTPAFKWQEIDPLYKHGDLVSTDAYRNMIIQPRAEEGFMADYTGMKWCDTGILLLPAGRSAHIEAGWLRGFGKPVYVIRPDTEEPDLMHKLCNAICKNVAEVCMAFDAEDEANAG